MRASVGMAPDATRTNQGSSGFSDRDADWFMSLHRRAGIVMRNVGYLGTLARIRGLDRIQIDFNRDSHDSSLEINWMFRTKLLAVFVCVLSIGMLSAAFGDGPVADKEGRSLYDRMIKAFRAADTLSFTSSYEIAAGESYSVKASYRIWMKKPNFFYVEGYLEDGTLTGVLIGDGEQAWTHWPNGRPMIGPEDETTYEATRLKVYVVQPAPLRGYSLAHNIPMVGNNMVMSVFQPSIFHGLQDVFEGYLGKMTVCEPETVDGEPCAVIDAEYMDGQRVRRFWISRNDHLPRRIRETVRASMTVDTTETWSDLKVNEPIPEERFQWTPPVDWNQFFMPEDDATLLKPGTVAPAFKLQGTDGKLIALADYHGKPVLLTIWRVGCPPCRSELPVLQKLHEQYAAKDLVVLGFNCMDNRDIAVALLKKTGITFPCVVDPSKQAQDTGLKQYASPSVPTTYAIGCDGKIVMAWRGYDKAKLKAAVKRLGL